MNSIVKSVAAKFPMLILFMAFLPSCDKDNLDIKGYDFSDSAGVFIVNEGNYLQDNASLSFLNLESMKLYNDVFYSANETRLGDIAYSMLINGNTGYIVINNSGRIYSIDARTGRFKGKLTGFDSPRYIHIVNGKKGYVTDLYSMKISIIDPSTFEITGAVDVSNSQHSTEQMAGFANYVFIGCWSYDNKILVLDTITDTIVDSITVTKQPNSLVVDRNNKLWVLSDGGFPGSAYGEEYAALTRINAETKEIEQVMQFPSMDDSPVDLELNGSGDTLYFILRGIRRMSINDTGLPSTPLIGMRHNDFYSIAIDKENSVIYAGDPLDYQQNGLLYRFTPDGELIDSFRVGINPGAFCFKN